MKMAIIHGQSHHGISYHVGRLFVDSFATTDTITEFFLPKDLPMFCLGCCRCLHDGEENCPHYLYTKPILSAIDEADLLVFTTPVYCMKTTGSMKAFLDHCFTRWVVHRPKSSMYFKSAVIISVGAGGGMKQAAKDIKTSLFYWGISNIKIYSLRGAATSWQTIPNHRKNKIEEDMKQLSLKIKNNSKTRVSLKSKILFMIMKRMQKQGSGASLDKEYWQEHGWLDKQKPWDSHE